MCGEVLVSSGQQEPEGENTPMDFLSQPSLPGVQSPYSCLTLWNCQKKTKNFPLHKYAEELKSPVPNFSYRTIF